MMLLLILLVLEKNTRTSIVPEDQIQIVDATHGATLTLTLLVAIQDEVSFINKNGDAATELYKMSVTENKTQERNSDKTSGIATPPLITK